MRSDARPRNLSPVGSGAIVCATVSLASSGRGRIRLSNHPSGLALDGSREGCLTDSVLPTGLRVGFLTFPAPHPPEKSEDAPTGSQVLSFLKSVLYPAEIGPFPLRPHVRNLEIGHERALSGIGRCHPRSRPGLRALSGQLESFDRHYFAPWLGARRMAMLAHWQRGATTPRRKRTRPPVGQIGPSGASRRSPDAQHRASRRSYPRDRFAAIKSLPAGRIVLWTRHRRPLVNRHSADHNDGGDDAEGDQDEPSGFRGADCSCLRHRPKSR